MNYSSLQNARQQIYNAKNYKAMIADDLKKQIEKEAEAEMIYEPKYGGKDWSGHETMMKYEVNDERYEAYEKGAFKYAELWQEEKKLTNELKSVLSELIRLKELKDIQGKTLEYLVAQPLAWDWAKNILLGIIPQKQPEIFKEVNDNTLGYLTQEKPFQHEL